ncbi:MAG: repeat-containing protein [Schlesneria sp.]|nr:repeat-containing protein [Schlesneria sp.]
MKMLSMVGLVVATLVCANVQAGSPEKASYQVVVCGFHCVHETHDHALEVDGKRDEVWIVVRYNDNTTKEYRVLRTRTMGDVNGNPGREQAGSASDKGGVRTGDVHPANRFDGKPVTPKHAEWAESDRPSLPFVVKKFELVKGQSPAAVEIQMFEDDNGGAKDWENVLKFLNSDAAKAGLSNITVHQSNNPVTGNTQVNVNLSGIGELAHKIFGLAADGWIGEPQTLALDFDSAAKMSTATVDGLPKGVVPLRFKTHRGDDADYIVWVRIEKISE